MHLLRAQKGTIAEGGEAVDLGQSPGDILFLSAADTELASVAGAIDALDGNLSLRLANLMQLRHPMSVDTYVERTARHASVIVVRLLGGESYWPYGVEALHAAAVDRRIALAVLPGDDKPDPGLDRFSTISPEDREALWRYLVEGGAENAASFLLHCRALIGDAEKPAGAAPLLKAGLWWPGTAWPTLDDLRGVWVPEAPAAAICFYRALVQSGQTAPVEALIRALRAEGINPLPVFISSLKDPVSVATLEAIFDEVPPEVVLNATGFAVSAPGAERKPTVLERDGAVVLQVVFSGSTAEAWEISAQGLSARDLAMNVALPEVDGRVLSRAVSFKSASRFDERVEANIVTHVPRGGSRRFCRDLAAGWARLRRSDPAVRRIALVLANYPNRDGRIGNGVGLDTPAGTMEVLKAMQAAGYPVDDLPADGDALVRGLMAGPTNAAVDAREIRETLSLSRYRTFLASLPKSIQEALADRWGEAEADPFFLRDRDGFALPLQRFGETLVGIQPARGYNIDPKETYHRPTWCRRTAISPSTPCLRECFGAHAVVHMGKHGNLEWLPGKALALSEPACPKRRSGPLPHLYPFIVNDPGEGTQAKRRTQPSSSTT